MRMRRSVVALSLAIGSLGLCTYLIALRNTVPASWTLPARTYVGPECLSPDHSKIVVNPDRRRNVGVVADATQDRGRLKRAVLEIPPQRGEVLIKLSREQLDADPIHTRLALVAFDGAKGFVHQLQGDSSRERMVLLCQWSDHRHCLRFHPQFDSLVSSERRAVEIVAYRHQSVPKRSGLRSQGTASVCVGNLPRGPSPASTFHWFSLSRPSPLPRESCHPQLVASGQEHHAPPRPSGLSLPYSRTLLARPRGSRQTTWDFHRSVSSAFVLK